MPSLAAMSIKARDDNGDGPFGFDDDDGFDVPWWHSKTALIVKWSIVGGIFALILLFVVGGYLHAQSRLKKGLEPLRYHRWLVRRSLPPPQQGGWIPEGQPPQGAYNMNNMPPPPVYDPTRPPAYSGPPEGGSKVDPSQWGAEPTHRPEEANPAPQYQPPSGPPPPPAA